MHVCALECQGEAKQLCETTIVVVARWAAAIAFNPFRMLHEERVVHLALQRAIRRGVKREYRKGRSRSYLAPDVLALRNRIEDSVPTAARVEDRHVQHQHRVMPTPARAKPLSRFLLIFGMHCDYFLSLGWSRLVANNANTSAQKIDVVIMAGPPNRPHSRLSPTAAEQEPTAIFERRVRKAFLVRVAAIRRRASGRKAQVRVGLA